MSNQHHAQNYKNSTEATTIKIQILMEKYSQLQKHHTKTTTNTQRRHLTNGTNYENTIYK